MRHTDDRPAAGAADAAADGAAVVEAAAVGEAAGEVDAAAGEVDAALDLVEQGLGRLAKVDATSLPEGCVTDAVRRLGTLDGRIDGIQARFVAAAAAAGVPQRSGASSTTNWVKQHTGRAGGGGQAARTSRLAKAAETAPELADAVASGLVGPDQANTIAAGLDRDELDADDVSELLPAARRQPPSMFRRQARQLAGRRRQQKLRDQELVARAERHHRQWRTPKRVAALRRAAATRRGRPDAKGHQRVLPARQHRRPRRPPPHPWPALRRRHGRPAGGGAALRRGRRRRRGPPPHRRHRALEAMAPLRDAEHAGITAVTDTGTVLSAAAFKKLACDAAVRRIVVDPDSRPLDVGRATRNWPGAIRAAVAAVDGGCRGPGCDLPPHRCIVHHVHWWEDGGPTCADKGALQCGHHHDLVHDHGWTLTMDPATRIYPWTAPDGTTIVTDPYGPAARSATPPQPTTSTAPAAHHQRPNSQTTAGSDDANAIETLARSTRSQLPHGRGDPGRPRSPGSDPPHRDRHDRAPPTRRDAEPLQLDL